MRNSFLRNVLNRVIEARQQQVEAYVVLDQDANRGRKLAERTSRVSAFI